MTLLSGTSGWRDTENMDWEKMWSRSMEGDMLLSKLSLALLGLGCNAPQRLKESLSSFPYETKGCQIRYNGSLNPPGADYTLLPTPSPADDTSWPKQDNCTTRHCNLVNEPKTRAPLRSSSPRLRRVPLLADQPKTRSTIWVQHIMSCSTSHWTMAPKTEIPREGTSVQLRRQWATALDNKILFLYLNNYFNGPMMLSRRLVLRCEEHPHILGSDAAPHPI
ncbi:hypothetical protein BJV78DRAFT_1320374 [Lactifluus subvellereus]|nr:hypothetical protein BJV78DRAFT_1320374 [Lactifluus subvellereus]